MDGNPDYDPWSIRQTAVYQQYNSVKDRSMFLLISPADTSRRMLEDTVNANTSRRVRVNPFDLHRILLSTLHRNWRAYIRDLEVILQERVSLMLPSYNLRYLPLMIVRPCHFIKSGCGNRSQNTLSGETKIENDRGQNTGSYYRIRISSQYPLSAATAMPDSLPRFAMHRLCVLEHHSRT